MNKQDILEKSRRDYAAVDEMEHHINLNSGTKANTVGIICCSLLFFLEAFFTNHFNFGILGIYFAMYATFELTKYTQLKIKQHLINGGLSLAAAILLVTAHLYTVLGR